MPSSKPKPINKRSKRYKGKKAFRKKKQELFQQIEYWVGFNEKRIAFIFAKSVHERFIVYKYKNIYSILDRETLTDIYQYPVRLFKPHKKLKNMGYIKELAKLLDSKDIKNKEELLEEIKNFLMEKTKIEKKADLKAKKEKEAAQKNEI